MDPVVTLQSIVTELPASSEGARYLSNLIDRMAQGRMSITTALGMLRYAHDDSSRFPVEDDRAALTMAYQELRRQSQV